MLGYATAMAGGIFYAVRHDERRISCVMALFTFYTTVFFDALPQATRNIVGRSGMIFCGICTLSVCLMLQRNAIPDVHPGSFTIGDTTYTSLSLALNAAFQFCLYTMKVVVKAYIFPKRFFLITSQLKSIKVDVDDANVLRGTASKIAREETADKDLMETLSFKKKSMALNKIGATNKSGRATPTSSSDDLLSPENSSNNSRTSSIMQLKKVKGRIVQHHNQIITL